MRMNFINGQKSEQNGLSRFLVVFLLFLAPCFAMANNVRITKELSINAKEINDQIALVNFKVEWDNSWRDDMNWDAVYIFLKYRKKGDPVWRHAYLMDGGHELLNSGYEFWMGRSSTTANRCMGIFVQRRTNGGGSAAVEMNLRWRVAENGLQKTDFLDEKVEYSASCIEMVYVPQGAFCLGDGVSEATFQTEYRPILQEWDVLKTDGSMVFSASGDEKSDAYRSNPPENAANRVNENRSGIVSNAWWATTAGESNWIVDFGSSPKAIRYFGVSGVIGYESYRPTLWKLQARNSNGDWIDLWEGNQDFWVVTNNSYPVPRAIKIDPVLVKPYRYYQIKVITSSYRAIANNISMTEVDLEQKTNDAYIVDRPSPIVMDMTTQLSARDKDTWSGTLNVNYPTGFNGFYAMKYEITQEQYVRFLNKLQYDQQKMRTVGNKLDELVAGNYIYGDKNNPTCRNGIAVGVRVDGGIVFTNNWNRSDTPAKNGDGQNIACNFLSPDDMLAYADWCGLRPMSEMEYEKMARAPYPAIPEQREWAGGNSSTLVMPASESISDPGKISEKANANGSKRVNINAGGAISGPLRVGALAVGAVNREMSGAGYWGIMDLSGNLAEMYYNCNTFGGRSFCDILESHGNGDILPNENAKAGGTDMSASYWPQVPASFILRGGSFKSANKTVAISDRSMNKYFSDMNKKDSTVSFRLGHSYMKLQAEANPETYLYLQNGSVVKQNGVSDTVCSGGSCTIRGSRIEDVKKASSGRHTFIWYVSENAGSTWQILRGEEAADLTYANFFNDGGEPREVWFKRRTITPEWWSETSYAVIRVINTNFTVNRLRDTITKANHVLGFWIDTRSNADFTWRWKSPSSGGVALKNTQKGQRWDFYAPQREDFNNQNGEQILLCEMSILKRCVKKLEMPVFVVERPVVGVRPEQIKLNGGDPSVECGVMMQDNRSTPKQLYATVRVGNQCWMAENLRHVVPGSSIYTSADPSGNKLGVLYYWATSTLTSACPPGWKIPTYEQMNTLIATLNADGNGRAGAKIKQGWGWNVNPSYKAALGTNESGMGMVGTGHSNGYFWTNSYFIVDNGWFGTVDWTSSTLSGSYYVWSGNYAMPIRCIKQ